MVEIIDTVDGLVALQSDWERIEKSNTALRVFQSYAWTYAAWMVAIGKSTANRLWIAKWSSNDDVVILPTYIDGYGQLRFLLDRGVDVGDAVYTAGYNHHLAYMEIAKAIQDEPRIRCVHLQKLSGAGEALNYLSVLLRPTIVYKDNAYSWLDIVPSDDFVSVQKHMRSKDRADLKNLRKKAAKYRLRILSVSNNDSFPHAEMCQLLAVMSNGNRRADDFLTDADVAFVRALYVAGKCEIALLEDNDGLQALNVILVMGSRRISWEFLYADPRAGTGLYLQYFESVKCSASYQFDFGVGVYGYKIGTFRPQMAITYSLRYGKGFARYVKAVVCANIRFVKDGVKKMMGN